jgi:hypothetical protein
MGAGMTGQSFINDPEHWRTRAEEARLLAKDMNDSASKDAMLRIAEDYEQLAHGSKNGPCGVCQRTEKREAGQGGHT